MDYLLYVDDCLIIAMMHVSLDLSCSRISWMLIRYFDIDPCCLFEVALWVMIGYSDSCHSRCYESTKFIT